MKIVHITSNYIDGWGYQENLLPLYQKRAGYDVVVISDNDHLKYAQNPSLAKEIIAKGSEYVLDGIKIYKIKTFLATSSYSFFCKGLYDILVKESPDIIFHHDINISTLTAAVRYKRCHTAVKLYVDSHVDWINDTNNRIWHWFYYDFLIPIKVKSIGDEVDYYIGVTPLRCMYLKKVFRVPQSKIRFLPIGCDVESTYKVTASRKDLREKYGLASDAFVVISGGKIDKSKGTLELIAACEELRRRGWGINLVLFGKIDTEVSNVIINLDWVKALGWCDRTTTLSLLKMSDVACWPWLHTTLIEDSVAVGTPLIVKLSDNVSHFAREKAGVFMNTGDKNEIVYALEDLKVNAESYRKNVLKAREMYSYTNLVQLLKEETFCEF